MAEQYWVGVFQGTKIKDPRWGPISSISTGQDFFLEDFPEDLVDFFFGTFAPA